MTRMATEQNPARQRAAANLNRLLFGGARGVDNWKAADGKYQREFIATAHLLADMEGLADDPDILALKDRPAPIPLRERTSARPSRWTYAPAWTTAALVVMAVALFGYFDRHSHSISDDSVQRHVTRIGEQKTVQLADGSTITLNTGTQLLVDITARERKVILERGEAWFDVAADAQRPFTVDTGFRSVTVLGTQFNIHKLPDQLQVAVIEGMVAMHSSQEAPSQIAPLLSEQGSDKSGRQYRIGPGWVAEFDVVRQQISAYAPDNMQALYSWRSGVLDFDGAPLVEVVRELNRYSGKKILIEDAGIIDLKVLGVFQIDRLEMALDGLEVILPVKVTHHFDRIVLTGEG